MEKIKDKIYDIVAELPTDEEVAEKANEWWKLLRPTTFIGWSDKLKNLSFPFKIIPMSKQFMEDCLNAMDAPPKHMKDVQAELVKMIPKKYWDGMFLKLISRSPKDWMPTDEHGKPQIIKMKDVPNCLLGSMRTLEDLVLLLHLPEAAIVVRPFIEFPAHAEWRVYVKDKQIQGISQYYYESTFPELTPETVKFTAMEIKDFMPKVIENMTIPDFIADIVMMEKPYLLETNPYWISDPCLFKSYDNIKGGVILARQPRPNP